MSQEQDSTVGASGFPPERPSASADAAFRTQLERTRAMTSRERMLLALELGDLCRRLDRKQVGP